MNTVYQLLPLVLLVFIMYVLLIRPQKRKEKAINAMRSSIKAGDDVITIGGIYGKVTRVRDESLTIQVGADRTKMEVTRWAISKLVEEGEGDSKASRSKSYADKDDQPAKKTPRRRLEKVQKTDVTDEPVEANPLETGADDTPLDQ